MAVVRSGGEGRGLPEAVPVAVQVLRAEGGDRGRTIFGPVHAAAFEALGHELFDGGFDQAGADGVALAGCRESARSNS